MFWKSFVIFTIACCITSQALDNDLARAKRSAETDILKLVSRSNNQLTRNPNQSLACFAYYTPIMNQIMETYEENYNVCVAIADDARRAADATTVEQRDELTAEAAIACDPVYQCKSKVAVESIYQCYIDEAPKSSTALKTLSSNASGKLVVFQKTLRSIASDEKICINENRLQYEKDWDRTYDEFTDCINGLIEVPTEAPSSLKSILSAGSVP